MYDPATNAWTGLPGSASAHAGAATGVINGKFYVAGGVNGSGAITNVVEVYDPAANTWTTVAPMKVAMQGAASVALNGELYVLGGNNGADVTTVQVYDPYKNKWRTLPALPSAVQVSGAVAVYGLIFMEGGDGGSGTMNQYSVLRSFDSLKNAYAGVVHILAAETWDGHGGETRPRYINCLRAKCLAFAIFSYSIRYSILIPRRSTSFRNASAGTSRSCSTAPCFSIAPEHIICRTIDAGNAVVRIMELMSVLGS